MAADAAWRRRILEAPRVDRVAALAEYGVTLKILGTVRAPDQWAAAGELRKRLLAAFHQHHIEIPRPQRVVLSRDAGAFPPGLDAAAGLAGSELEATALDAEG
jgi:small-conductance mechanosensitive channel